MFHILLDLVPALSIVNERFQGAGSFCCHYVGWLEKWLLLNNNVKEGASEQEEVESREDERGDRVRVRYQMKTDTQYLVVVPT